MAVFNEPTKWAQTLGKDADVVTIPDTAGETDPSIDKIFPAIFSIPLAQGGRAIPRSVLNGLFKLVGDWSFYQQNGGLASYSADFDYTVGRVVLYNNNIYKCIQDNGVSSTVANPDNVAYWHRLDDSNLIPNQIITSPVPLTDANLHLCDGALLSGSGAYAQYVSMMIALYNSDTSASCWTDEATWQSSVSTYGECGKFVVDTVNNTVRLPKLSSFIQSTTTASELGDLVEAGVPDITGTLSQYASIYGIGTNAFKNTAIVSSGVFNGGNSGHNYNVAFKASDSNSIYGNSNTIQPQAIKYYHYIVLGTVSKTQIQIDIDNVLTDLNGKADRDLANSVGSWADPVNVAMAHNAMPSNVSDELTLGASGDSYTAPADGYFMLSALGSAVGQRIQINTSALSSIILYPITGSYSFRIYVPIKKGDTALVIYTTAQANTNLKFFYAVGSESEQ